jgi:pimeloyl-ACP methyl ester carboxylesterase
VRVRKVLIWGTGVAAILYLGFLALLFFAQGSIIYPGAKNHVDPSPPKVPGLEVLSTVAHFAGPVLVIHGREDRLIPWQEGRHLAAAAKNATFRLYECGHGCWDPEHLPFWKDAEPFLVDAGLMQTARAR